MGTDHDSVVEDWKQNAKNRDEESYQFLRGMKFQDYGFDPDDLAGQLHEEVADPVVKSRCENDGLDFEQYSIGADDLEPDTGGTLDIEQPQQVTTRLLSPNGSR